MSLKTYKEMTAKVTKELDLAAKLGLSVNLSPEGCEAIADVISSMADALDERPLFKLKLLIQKVIQKWK